jgi:Tfp pilus assembly protein PilF
MSDGARDLLVRGIAAAKAGERDEARHYLEWALRQEPSSDEQIEA